MRQHFNQNLFLKTFIFVLLTLIVSYIIHVISSERGHDIPDALITIYSLVVSSSMMTINKLLSSIDEEDDEDDNDENIKQEQLSS